MHMSMMIDNYTRIQVLERLLIPTARAEVERRRNAPDLERYKTILSELLVEYDERCKQHTEMSMTGELPNEI